LIPYLLSRRVIEAGDVPRITPLAGGVSNRTVLVEPSERPPFVLKQALKKLRVAADWFSSPGRIHREAEGMRFLRHLAPAGTITEFHFEDFSEHILAMSMVPRPHRTWKELLLSEPPVPRHFEQFAAILARIHVCSYGDQGLAQIFDDRTGFESLRLEPYYHYSAARVPVAKPFLENLIAETLGQRLALVHGDYGPKNILVHEGRFVLVDHEVIHFGDPAFDLGFSLTHLLAWSRQTSTSADISGIFGELGLIRTLKQEPAVTQPHVCCRA
jgi:5-methylthioribose kinase